MKKVLITGTSGYVASHMAKYLARRNLRVFGLDSRLMIPALRAYLENNLQADISDYNRVVEYIRANRITDVIHCAAKCLVGESTEKPEMYEDHNVRRAQVLIRACLDEGIKSFSLSSTAAVYGEPISVPIQETHPRRPINPYGETKKTLENHLFELAKQRRLKVGILRYFNVAGADPEAEVGEDHAEETHLVPNAIFAALGKKKHFELFGEDYPTRDGTCVRDYIHVMDLAKAHALLLKKLESAKKPLVYNLGTRFGYSVKEVLDEIDRQVSEKIKRRVSPRRPGDPAVLIADASKAQRDLSWKAELSDLATIVRTALRWHERQAHSE